jgi:hypothetical protein
LKAIALLLVRRTGKSIPKAAPPDADGLHEPSAKRRGQPDRASGDLSKSGMRQRGKATSRSMNMSWFELKAMLKNSVKVWIEEVGYS